MNYFELLPNLDEAAELLRTTADYFDAATTPISPTPIFECSSELAFSLQLHPPLEL
jgi:hypothetical protein